MRVARMPDPSDPKARQRRSIEHWGDQEIAPGERANVEIHATQRADGVDAHIPVHVWRGLEPGPTVFVTAAIHGDEINGTGVIRDLIVDSVEKYTRFSVQLIHPPL